MGGLPDATVVLMVRAGCFPLMIAHLLGLHTGDGEYPIGKSTPRLANLSRLGVS